MSADGVESENEGCFASEMSEEDDFGTFPDLGRADEFALRCQRYDQRLEGHGHDSRAVASTCESKE